MTFEVGGKNKDRTQIKGVENGWLAVILNLDSAAAFRCGCLGFWCERGSVTRHSQNNAKRPEAAMLRAFRVVRANNGHALTVTSL